MAAFCNSWRNYYVRIFQANGANNFRGSRRCVSNFDNIFPFYNLPRVDKVLQVVIAVLRFRRFNYEFKCCLDVLLLIKHGSWCNSPSFDPISIRLAITLILILKAKQTINICVKCVTTVYAQLVLNDILLWSLSFFHPLNLTIMCHLLSLRREWFWLCIHLFLNHVLLLLVLTPTKIHVNSRHYTPSKPTPPLP
jgi:hypothetical protein